MAMLLLANKDLVHRFYDEVFNANQPELVGRLLAAGFVDHNPAPGQMPDREGLKDLFTTYRAAFPDAFMALEDMIAEDDRVATRLTLRGTHLGGFLGVAPTGRPVRMTAVDIWRVQDGRIVERWGNRDDLSLREQVGALPAMATDPKER